MKIQRPLITAISYVSLGLVSAGAVLAQDQTPPAPRQQDQGPRPWRRVGDAPPDAGMPSNPDQAAGPTDQAPPPPPPPGFSANQQGPYPDAQNQAPYPYPPQGQYGNQGRQSMNPAPMRPSVPVPPTLTIKPGTYVTVRTSQWLSSDRNQQGDAFFATLAEPLIVDGVVVAQRGQTVSGRVTEAQKAGRVEGTSKLGVELTGITLVDGQQLSMQSQMMNRVGPTSVGRDAGAIAGTTALGAAIGAGADWGRGAAIGAGAGAAAGILGVLLTRGRPSVIYPESTLTFRTTAALVVATDRAPQAFRYVEAPDYTRGGYSGGPAPRYANGPGEPPPAYYPAPYYGPAYYPYYGGPGFSLYVGRPYYYGGFYRGGFYRGYRR